MSTVITLNTKKEEIERAIIGYEAALTQARSDLAAILTTIACFTEGDHRTPVAPYHDLNRLFARGEMTRMARVALAQHGPLSTTELAEKIMTAKGFDAGNKVMRKTIGVRLVQGLRVQFARGLFIDAGRRKGVRVWSLP